MKILFFADVHLHNWNQCSTILGDGFNSRFLNGLAVVKRILDDAIKYRVDLCVFGGDLFHDRSSIATETLGPVIDAFKYAVKSGVKIVALPGNHDYSIRRITSCVTNILDSVGVRVISGFEESKYGGTRIVFIPYQHNDSELKRAMESVNLLRPNLAFMHQGLQGVQSRSGYVLMGEPLKREWLPSCKVFSGHIHECQRVNNFYYVGSPMQLDWGDVGIKKYYFMIEVQGKTVYVVKHRVRDAPEFKNLFVNTTITKGIGGNFVRYVCNGEKELRIAMELSAQAQRMGAAFVAHPVVVDKKGKLPDSTEDPILSIEQMINEYVELRAKENKRTLKNLGQRIIMQTR